MAGFKRILNHPEEIADEHLREVCETVHARAFAKVRVADVLDIDKSGISGDLFGFALRSHFDFVVTDRDKMPLFAVEVDGRQHQDDEQQRARDVMKDSLCSRFHFPLLRVTLNHLKREFRGMVLLTWFVEWWFMQKGIDEAIASGSVPADAGLDPMWTLSIPGRPGKFPMLLGLDAQCELRRMHARKEVLTHFVTRFTGYDKNDRAAAFGLLGIEKGKWAVSVVFARKQLFPVRLTDLLEELLSIEMLSAVQAMGRGELLPQTATEALDQLEAFVRQYKVGSVGFSPPFPNDGKSRPHLDINRMLWERPSPDAGPARSA